VVDFIANFSFALLFTLYATWRQLYDEVFCHEKVTIKLYKTLTDNHRQITTWRW